MKSKDRADRVGLQLISDNSTASMHGENAVDIIAIHGLKGAAISTWKHRNGTMWLESLPARMPGCHVYSYGYKSRVFCSSSMAGVQDLSRGLLSSVRDHFEESLPVSEKRGSFKRCPLLTGSHQAKRPTIFVCHSLGGIVFNQVHLRPIPMPSLLLTCGKALVYAHSDQQDRYEWFVRSIIGVVYLGTPHRGSCYAGLAYWPAMICGLSCFNIIRVDLLRYLRRNSAALDDLRQRVRPYLQKMLVVSFYETAITWPAISLVRRNPPICTVDIQCPFATLRLRLAILGLMEFRSSVGIPLNWSWHMRKLSLFPKIIEVSAALRALVAAVFSRFGRRSGGCIASGRPAQR